MKVSRNIIEIDEALCNGCGECVVSCAEGALRIIDGKARLVSEIYCDGLGACLGHCPTGALKVIVREAEDFDEKAVEEMLKGQGKSLHPAPAACTSTKLQMHPTACQTANVPASFSGASALSHWPVQIKLVPPTAPFLKGAELLIAADCVPVAYPGFHAGLLKGRAVVVGCPKFDNANEYYERFKELFKVSGVKGVTVAVMEVPCCQALKMVVKKAVEDSGMDIPVNVVTISTKGAVL